MKYFRNMNNRQLSGLLSALVLAALVFLTNGCGDDSDCDKIEDPGGNIIYYYCPEDEEG
jgi:hypothetical protein